MSAGLDPNFDPHRAINLIRNSDGSITRTNDEPPKTPASCNVDSSSSATQILSKDVPLNLATTTSIRLFLPHKPHSTTTTKLPLIIYIHGGGFIIHSAASTEFHVFCSTIAAQTPAVIASIDYRLAPENRLPAAYDDCMEAIHWVKNTNETWLTEHADLSNCFIMGSSAGGNIAYHIALRTAALADDLKPFKIKGLILHQPFFGGVERTPSEIRLSNAVVIPVSVTDLMWELSLPVGADRDHEYCNVVKELRPEFLDMIKEQGWNVIVTGCDGDPLIDRQIELVKVLKEKGVAVDGKFTEGEYHAYDVLEPSKSDFIIGVVKEIVKSPEWS